MKAKLPFKEVHCLGIGGVGVCGIARLLAGYGVAVSGADSQRSMITQQLVEEGIDVFIGQVSERLADADVVVYSSAVKEDNPAMVAAKASGATVMKRAEMLGVLMNLQKGIAISGTHGKTTTTSLVAYILYSAGVDPSFSIGGELQSLNEYARLGQGDYFVAEADESDASFLHLSPDMAIVTNIDLDHMETYSGSLDVLCDTFASFISRLPVNGLAVLPADDPNLSCVLTAAACPCVTFGVNEQADYRVHDFSPHGLQSHFNVTTPEGELTVTLNLPGQHNAQNAAAAIAVARAVGVPDAKILKALLDFPGVGRRFSVRGELPVPGGKALLIDDYGHHPAAVDVTLSAARDAFPDRRLVLVFQPHRYTRTRDLLIDFAKALANADVLIVLEVYSAGEAVIESADGQTLCRSIEAEGKVIPLFVPDIDALPDTLQAVLQAGDVVLLQGAGTIGKVASTVLGLG